MEGASVDNLQSFLSLGLYQGSNQGPLEGLFPDRAFSPLPPKDEIILLVNDYLQQFNSLCPIFQPSSLLSLCEESNLPGLLNFPGRWASLNVVLAIGYMVRIKNTSIVQADRQKSWLFMKNALGVLDELCIGLPDLWTVQALVGMVRRTTALREDVTNTTRSIDPLSDGDIKQPALRVFNFLRYANMSYDSTRTKREWVGIVS